MKIGYTSSEVCRIIGVSYRQLDYWDSSGFIQPSVARARGTGTSRMYSFIDLVCLRTAKKLRDSGISLQKIRKSVDYLRTHFPALDSPLADMVFLTDGSAVFILTRDRNTALDTVMDQGQLVPDDLIVAMMMKEIESADSGAGYVLDGFPRTLGQAQELDKALESAGKKVDVVLELQVDDEKLEERVTGRRSCPKCGGAYHITFMPPKQQEQCDNGCGELFQRPDDTSEVIRNRIATYHKQTAPLVSYYGKAGNVRPVDGNVEIEQVKKSLLEILDEYK